MFGHWFEILVVVFVGLLVFGPKRMLEMGSQAGKMVRELRESTRDLNFSKLLSTDEPLKPPVDETVVEGSTPHTDDIAI